MTKTEIKSFIEGINPIKETSILIGQKFAELFNIEFGDLDVKLLDKEIEIHFLDNDKYIFEFIRIKYDDLADPDMCVNVLATARREAVANEKYDILIESIERLEKDKIHLQHSLEEIEKTYKNAIKELYKIEGMNILNINPKYWNYIQYETISNVQCLMGEYFIKTGCFSEYNARFEKGGVIIKFYDIEEEPSYYDDYYYNDYDNNSH